MARQKFGKGDWRQGDVGKDEVGELQIRRRAVDPQPISGLHAPTLTYNVFIRRALQQHSRANPLQPINKHLTGAETQYREQQ